MNLRIFNSPEEVAAAAAAEVVRRAVDGSVIALSGGSTPAALYTLLGQERLLREKSVTWVMIDERRVPPGHPQSNASMVERTLFASGMSPRHRFLRFRTELEEPAAIVARFEEEWRSIGIGSLDLAILGVGEDGHTASLFPGTEALAVDDRVATAVHVAALDSWRVTLTFPVIRSAGFRMVVAAGASKQPIVARIRDGELFPIVTATAGDIESWWFVDRAVVTPPAET